MKNKIFIILLMLLVFFSISTIVAEDVNNDTLELDATDNIDVQSDDMSENLKSYNDSGLLSDSGEMFDDLQDEINNAPEGSTLVLQKDYYGAEETRIQLHKSLTIDGNGHVLDCERNDGCIAFESSVGTSL